MSRYNKDTLNALLSSAKRWEASHPDDLGDWKDCPLCSLHRKEVQGDGDVFGIFISCNGCPIRDKTGKHGCEQSPYDAFFEAKDEDDAADKAQVFSRWLFALYEEVKDHPELFTLHHV